MRETDKLASGIIPAYESLFESINMFPKKYLEIGIADGGSLEWAKEYFWDENSKIYGLDITLPAPIDGVLMERIDQADTDALRSFAEAHGPFDIIVDDASHNAGLTQRTFEVLYPFSGCYIIEDWGAGYFPQYEGLQTLVLDLVAQYGGYVVKLNEGPVSDKPVIDGGGTFAVIGEGPFL